MVSKAFSLQKGWKYEILQDIAKLFFLCMHIRKKWNYLLVSFWKNSCFQNVVVFFYILGRFNVLVFTLQTHIWEAGRWCHQVKSVSHIISWPGRVACGEHLAASTTREPLHVRRLFRAQSLCTNTRTHIQYIEPAAGMQLQLDKTIKLGTPQPIGCYRNLVNLERALSGWLYVCLCVCLLLSLCLYLSVVLLLWCHPALTP